MASDKPNPKMVIWDQVKNTPPSATKTQHFDGRDVTTINGQYVYQRATELFGPIGKGWGFDILTDRFDQGAPIQGGTAKSSATSRCTPCSSSSGTCTPESAATPSSTDIPPSCAGPPTASPLTSTRQRKVSPTRSRSA